MMKRRLKYFNVRKEVPDETTTFPDEAVEWEMRPGGMLVQKRTDNSDSNSRSIGSVLVRVEYGAARFQISTIPQSSFGELKKKLTVETGLQPDEQRLVFRGKVRGDGEYLDMCGVKNGSKMVLEEDPDSMERKAVEMRRNAKIQAVNGLIDDVATEVNRLEEQVCAIEKSIANGNKVAELQITTLIEMLMRQAIKLDSVTAQGDACAKKDLQGKRVQKCVESLDMLKVSNAKVKVPVVSTTKWGISHRTPSGTNTREWEVFE